MVKTSDAKRFIRRVVRYIGWTFGHMVLRRSSLKYANALVLAASCGMLVAGCADGGSAPELALTPRDGGATEPSRIYKLGVGDKLKINVFGEPDLSGAFDVNAIGNVALPLVGEIPAKGRPITDFRTALARRLSEGYLKNPKVTVDVLNYRPIYVHGEVKQGGELAYKSGVKLRDVVAQAGGYTYRAEKSYVLIVREGQNTEYKVRLPSDIDVLPGDNVRVPERFF